jgi:hypothetical protein
VTVEELYNGVLGVPPRPQPGFYSTYEDNWRRDPRSNPMLQQSNEDYDALAYQEAQHALAQKLLKRGMANDAKAKLNTLRQYANNPYAISLDSPNTPPELQNILQDEYNGGVRGFGMQVADAKRRQAEYLKNIDLQLKLQANKRANTQAELANDRLNQQIYQQDRLFDLSQEKNNIGWDRNDIRAQAIQGGEMTKDYQDALGMVEAGVPIQNILQSHRLSPAQQQRLVDYGNQLVSQRQQDYGGLQAKAGELNSRLSAAQQQAQAAYLNSLKGRFYDSNPDPVEMQRRIAAAGKPIIDAYSKDKNLQRMLTYDANVDAFSPVDPNPRGQMGDLYQQAPPRSQSRLPFVTSLEQLRAYPPGTQVMTPGGIKIVPDLRQQKPRGPYDFQQNVYY